MARYQAQLARVGEELAAAASGIGIVEHPASEHVPVLAAMAAQLPTHAAWSPLTAAHIAAPPAPIWVATFAGDPADLLERLNRARDTLARSTWLIVVVDRRQREALQRHAPDVAAGASFVLSIDFEPDPQVDRAAARAELTHWQAETYGRLDLRGLARSEGEDVAFTVLDVYQELACEAPEPQLVMQDDGRLASQVATEPLIVRLRSAPSPRRQVVLGAPGSGKSFFLRWLALSPDALGSADVVSVLVPINSLGAAIGPRPLEARVLDRLLETSPRAAHALHAWARAGQLRWLFDGLDETGDAESRKLMVAALAAFAARWPECDIVVTSRVAGYQEASLPEPFGVSRLAPFSEESVGRFLERWMTLYARQARGAATQVAEEARAQAALLAKDILANPRLRALAETPLLLTLIAILHRTGLRLPRNRVELYEHATRVLVERWNRVRSGSGTDAPPPISAADAVRLLGPIALASIQRTNRGQITEAELRDALAARLGRSPMSIASVDEAVALFQRTLGVLVETAPGMFGFLHLTLAEYFAARELVRTGALEALVADPARVFRPEWQEIILLAASELGILRAEDERLGRVVAAIVGTVPATDARAQEIIGLLFGLLDDDPSLSDESAEAILGVAAPLVAMDGSLTTLERAEPHLRGRTRFTKQFAGALKQVLAIPDAAKWTRRHVDVSVPYRASIWSFIQLALDISIDASFPIIDALRSGRHVDAVVFRPSEVIPLLLVPPELRHQPQIDGRSLVALAARRNGSADEPEVIRLDFSALIPISSPSGVAVALGIQDPKTAAWMRAAAGTDTSLQVHLLLRRHADAQPSIRDLGPEHADAQPTTDDLDPDHADAPKRPAISPGRRGDAH